MTLNFLWGVGHILLYSVFENALILTIRHWWPESTLRFEFWFLLQKSSNFEYASFAANICKDTCNLCNQGPRNQGKVFCIMQPQLMSSNYYDAECKVELKGDLQMIFRFSYLKRYKLITLGTKFKNL